MQTIGVGMIGSGFMGLTYSEVVARHATGCRLVAITGGRRAVPLAADYGVSAEASVEDSSRGTMCRPWCWRLPIWIDSI